MDKKTENVLPVPVKDRDGTKNANTRRYSSSKSQDNPQTSSVSRKRQRQSEVKDEEKTSYTLLRSSGRVADWDELLRDLNALSYLCPVDYFSHAPFARKWKEFATSKMGTKMELLHPRSIGDEPVYCVATILAFAGYKALVRFENSGNGSQFFAWITYCSDIPKVLGFAIVNNFIVLPVDGMDGPVIYDQTAHVQFMNQVYALDPNNEGNTNSISQNHGEEVREEVEKAWKNGRFKLNQMVEAMDNENPVCNRVATVTAFIGDRVHIKYHGRTDKKDPGYCFHIKSELLHPFGWSHAVGQTLLGISENFIFPTFRKKSFPPVPGTVTVKPGMMFEVRHPFHPNKIVPGVVQKKLRHGYFVAKIETNNLDDNAEYVFHVTSDYILPCGFSLQHKIEFEVPQGEDYENFLWSDYFAKMECEPLAMVNPNQTRTHKFVKGCKLEAVDICQPTFLGPATIVNVAQHMLKLHFDGWPRSKLESYQWVSAFSWDIYPAGWAEMIGHSFQGHADRPQPQDHYFIAEAE